MTSKADAGTPSAVIDRVSLVLNAFEGHGRLTLTQVARRTGLPRSSTHRMLDQLVQLRFLRRQGRDYELGMRLVELGHLAVHQDQLHRAAVPFLWDLHRVTGFVVHLAVLDGSDVVYLDKIGDRMVTRVPSRIGGRFPAHCTGVGKALLAHSDDDLLSGCDVGAQARRTGYSISTRAQLAEDLTKVRARGYAFDREESSRGFGCVATVVGPSEKPVAALSVCGPVEQMRGGHHFAGPVRMAALHIWQNMADRSTHVRPTLQQLGVHRLGADAQRFSPAVKPGALQYA